MHPLDVLHYGHLTLMNTLNEFPEDQWETPEACGVWSVKDIVAHLASFEQVLVELCQELSDGGPTPTLDDYRDNDDFNDRQVAQRGDLSPAEALAEYRRRYQASKAAVARLPTGLFRQTGVLPWYGEEYDLEDFLLYTFYGHKREHSAQVAALRDRLTA